MVVLLLGLEFEGTSQIYGHHRRARYRAAPLVPRIAPRALRCREVVELLATDGWRYAPPARRLALGPHLMMCRHCRAYRRALHRLGAATRRLYETAAVDPQQRERLVGAVRQAVKRFSPG